MKVKTYTDKLNKAAREGIERYRKAEEDLKFAEQAVKQTPEKAWGADAEYMAKAAMCKANLIRAQEGLKAARQAWEDDVKAIKGLRGQLAAELKEAYGAKPSELDLKTMELIRSGILRSSEYRQLMDDAVEHDNYTMVRLLKKSALEAADQLERKRGTHDPEAYELKTISYNTPDPENNILQSWDYLVECLSRTANNPAMSDYWDNLTGETVESLSDIVTPS